MYVYATFSAEVTRLASFLNEKSAEGWELVSTFDNHEDYRIGVIMKRLEHVDLCACGRPLEKGRCGLHGTQYA